MSKDSVMVYWVEADNFELCNKPMGSADIFRGGTYESEVIQKYARNPLDSSIVVIPFNQSGSDWAKSQVQHLRDRSSALRKSGDQ